MHSKAVSFLCTAFCSGYYGSEVHKVLWYTTLSNFQSFLMFGHSFPDFFFHYIRSFLFSVRLFCLLIIDRDNIICCVCHS